MTEDVIQNIRKLHEEDERFFLSIRTEKAPHVSSGDTRIQAPEWSLDAHNHRGVLLAEVERLSRHVDALQEKVVAESCACGYDSPDAVCLAHSPQLMAAGVEIEKLTRERDEARYFLKIFVHAHARNNAVPPHIEHQARKALEAKP